jgi:hypothetical protein
VATWRDVLLEIRHFPQANWEFVARLPTINQGPNTQLLFQNPALVGMRSAEDLPAFPEDVSWYAREHYSQWVKERRYWVATTLTLEQFQSGVIEALRHSAIGLEVELEFKAALAMAEVFEHGGSEARFLVLLDW